MNKKATLINQLILCLLCIKVHAQEINESHLLTNKIELEILTRELFINENLENTSNWNANKYHKFKYNISRNNIERKNIQFLNNVYITNKNPERYLLESLIINANNVEKQAYSTKIIPQLFKKNNYESVNSYLHQLSKLPISFKNGLELNQCIHEVTGVTSNITFCVANIINLPVPNFDEMTKILCRNSKSDSCVKYIQNKETELQKYFPKLTIKSFQQKLKVGGEYFPILDKITTAISIELNEENILFKDTIANNTYYFDEEFETCIANNNCTYVNLNVNSDFSYLEPIQHEAFEYFQKVISNYKCSIQTDKKNKKYLYLKVLKAVKEFEEEKSKITKSLVRPVFKVECSFKDDKNVKHDNLLLIVDALNGRIISKSKALVTIYPEENSKENENNDCDTPIFEKVKDAKLNPVTNSEILKNDFDTIIYNFNNFNRLSQSMLCNHQIPNIDYNIKLIITKDCSSKNLCDGYKYACSTPDLLCFMNSRKIQFNTDNEIIIHESAHNIIPNMLENHNTRENLRILFHDLADTFTNIYTDTNCIGASINSHHACQESKINPLPRKIDFNDNIYDFSKLKNSDYIQGEIASYMFSNVYTVFKTDISNHNEVTYQKMKHWIRTFRSIKIFNFIKSPCLNCDIDFYLGLQNLMKSYLIQLVDTNDLKYKKEILYNWSKSGFLTGDISCYTDNLAENYCLKNRLANKNSPSHLYTGLDNLMIAKLFNENKDNFLNLKIKTATGFKFNFLDNIEVLRNNCNQYLEVSIFNQNKLLLSIKRKIKDSDFASNCHLEKNIKIEVTDYTENETYKILKNRIANNEDLNIKATTKFEVINAEDYQDIISN